MMPADQLPIPSLPFFDGRIVAQIEVTYGPSLFDRLGPYPALLGVMAVLLGIGALILRRRDFNIVAVLGLLAIGFLGFGATAWRHFQIAGELLPYASIDPFSAYQDISLAWLPAGFVLPACGIGMFLVAISWLLTRHPRPARSEK